jgi:DedD protein
MEQGAIKNLEQIQEEEHGAKTPRAVTAAFVALGGACVVFAALALTGRKSSAPSAVDPLGDLVAQRTKSAASASAAAPKPTDLALHDVTFPGILSDSDRPTTALAAVRGNAASSAAPPEAPKAPPPGERLPVVPLPARAVLEASPVVTRPRDALTKAASDSAQIAEAPAATAPSGKDGGYQLQVSSFRSQPEANQFSDQLRARGHKAYVVEAHVPGRGTWYRVRIGPFASQQSASSYRSTFEAKEHVVPFVVQPKDKT